MTPAYRHWTQTSPAYQAYQAACERCDDAFSPVRKQTVPSATTRKNWFAQYQAAQQARIAKTNSPRHDAAEGEDLATGKQVDRIMSLLRRRWEDGDEGGWYNGPTTRDGVSRMSRASASRYINSLSNAY